MIGVALVDLNLGAALATSKYYPRRTIASVRIWSGQRSVTIKPDGSTDYGAGNFETGYRRTLVVWRPLPPRLLQVWSPLIASVACTLLVVLVPWWRSTSPRQTDTANADRYPVMRGPRLWFPARSIAIVMALIGLNLAAAVYRPSELVEYDPQDLLRGRWEGTVVSKTDGTVIAYKCSPGEFTNPSEIRPPARSLLQIWFPVIASVAITLWVITNRPVSGNEAHLLPDFSEYRNRRGLR
jgi:hypothetical protein